MWRSTLQETEVVKPRSKHPAHTEKAIGETRGQTQGSGTANGPHGSTVLSHQTGRQQHPKPSEKHSTSFKDTCHRRPAVPQTVAQTAAPETCVRETLL